MTTEWVLLAVGALLVVALHAFLFWWAHGPGKKPQNAYEPSDPSVLPGGEDVWAHAYAIAFALPVGGFIAARLWFDSPVETAVYWAIAVLIVGDLLLFGAALGLFAVTHNRRKRQRAQTADEDE